MSLNSVTCPICLEEDQHGVDAHIQCDKCGKAQCDQCTFYCMECEEDYCFLCSVIKEVLCQICDRYVCGEECFAAHNDKWHNSSL